MKAALILLTGLEVLFLVATFVFAFLAIWNIHGDSGQWGGMAALCGASAFFGGMALTIAWTERHG